MNPSVQIPLPPLEVNLLVQGPTGEDNSLVLKRRFLRQAIDDSGWKHDAVACQLGIDAPYLSKMLAGEKPITLKQLDALPDDVERHYARLYAEHFGLIVIERVDDATASRHLASGLFNLLRADRMAKAFPVPTMAKVSLK